MPYAITQTCCNDATCVKVCPVNCIHPTPDEPDFGTTEMLYIDPASCIDCGACADACPVDAIFPVERLTAQLRPYAEVNAAYYADRVTEPGDPSPNFHRWSPPVFHRNIPSDFAPLDIAVVGTGPAGMYAVEDLLLHTNCRITLIDRLPVAGGLVRYGVAPDHPSTKKIGEAFSRFHTHPRLRMRLGVEVGRDITVDELAAEHDAVIYAVGASSARSLGIPGEDLPGSVPATRVVAWYNGHPDVPGDAVDLSAERVVVVGTGNVALDVARILTTDPNALAGTTISPAALARLRSSQVREVVLLARRGPDAAAYTSPELLALLQRGDVELVVDSHDPQIAATIDAAAPGTKAALLRDVRREAVDWSAPRAPASAASCSGSAPRRRKSSGTPRSAGCGSAATWRSSRGGWSARSATGAPSSRPALRLRDRDRPARGGPGPAGHLRDRVDQARTLRRHRRQPHVRAGDRRFPAGGRDRRSAAQGGHGVAAGQVTAPQPSSRTSARCAVPSARWTARSVTIHARRCSSAPSPSRATARARRTSSGASTHTSSVQSSSNRRAPAPQPSTTR